MHDGEKYMMGKRSGASTHILVEQLKATATRFQELFRSLKIKSLTKDCLIIRDVIGNVEKYVCWLNIHLNEKTYWEV